MQHVRYNYLLPPPPPPPPLARVGPNAIPQPPQQSEGIVHEPTTSSSPDAEDKEEEDEGEEAIDHLMETPGLELTRAELESLFDLVDENGDGGGDVQRERGGSKGGSKSGDNLQLRPLGAGAHTVSEGARQERSDSSLILFLRRCGLRRREGACYLIRTAVCLGGTYYSKFVFRRVLPHYYLIEELYTSLEG